ncbi:F-box domain-containing protein [Mycena sanguinolenta]|uniref:F-box domain-containing protein n=1 Tax=Mycena sanguinolenta TaxID=230812 RepID=A0A8H6Z152_9AGAR|nr:F-box domain-containing protein [Mycena sanguinolenta]
MTATAIFRLPNELLVAIAAAGQEKRIAETFSQHSRWQTPSATFKSEWTMSQLSRRFRAAIIGAPNLWILAEAELEHQGSVEVLKLYLERSQACKISITLRESQTSDLEYDHLLDRISLIAAHFNQIQMLRIAITDCRKEMWNLFRDAAAPVLEHLELINVYNKVGDTVEMFSSGAPKLKFFKLDNFVLDSFSAPWTASLTHLELLKCPANTPDLPPIVAQSPQLIRLHLDTDFDRSGAQVHIPTLEFLHVVIPNEEDSDYLVAILNLFDTPALTELKIEGSHGDQIAVLFNSTLLTSFPVLTSLSFLYKGACGCDSTDDFSYRPIAKSPPLFPTLTSLTLVNQCFIRNLIPDILGPDAPPRHSLNTVTLYLKDNPEMVVQNVCIDLEEAGKARRERGDVLPKVQLFHTVSAFYNWDNGAGLDFEMMSIW